MNQRSTSFLKIILLYGLLLGVVLAGFKLFEYSYFSHRITLDIYLGITAIAFLVVGIIIGVKSRRSTRSTPASGVHSNLNNASLETETTPDNSSRFTLPGTTIETELSERELEVLTHIAEGRTNPEIAEVLFLSPNTIKSHVSNIYRKLDVERRAQAVARAKSLKILK
ncbi:MAG: response regulator transcription factor [Ignavibacteriae bacterium]|nr:response regulator transcription factor [Ignavibacteriota bacterium]MCB9215436.1 response regulator transcription factor [Ignavibacteria bacterium]